MPFVVQSATSIQEQLVLYRDNLLVAGGFSAHCYLIKEPFVPTPWFDPSVLAEADFDGYVPPTINAVGQLVRSNANGWWLPVAAPLTWTCTGSATPNTIYGFWMADTSGNFIMAGTLDAPVRMAENGDWLALSIVFGGAICPQEVIQLP